MKNRMSKFILAMSFSLLYAASVYADGVYYLPPGFSLSTTVTASFNGGPFATSASLSGITFQGLTFTFTPNGSGNPPWGTMNWNGSLAGLTGADSLTVRLTFDPAAASSPDHLDFQFPFHPNQFNPNVINFDYANPQPVTFSYDIYRADGIVRLPPLYLNFLYIQSYGPEVFTDANLRVTELTPAYVPEPASLSLLGTGVGALAYFLRRNRRTQ